MQDIKTHALDVYPIVQHYMRTLGIHELFSENLPLVREEASHANCLCILISNIIIETVPLYKISDWLKVYTDGKGEYGYDSNYYTDDKLGSSLDALYAADRHSLLSVLSSRAIKLHDLKTDVVHNDSTSISLSGSYDNVVDKGSAKPMRGHNKDGRPDAKQIVFNLSVLGDGHVPILASCHDGNTEDSETHKVNWDTLKTLLNRVDFYYIADSKVATIENMAHIAGNKGKFISILPASRKEVKEFLSAVLEGDKEPAWEFVLSKADTRNKGQQIVYQSYSGEKTREGYTLHWIHSSSKAQEDAQRRTEKLLKTEAALAELQPKLNRYYLKEKPQIEKAIAKILQDTTEFFDVQIQEHQYVKRTKIGRGRIGENSTFKEEIFTKYSITWSRNEQYIAKQSKIDGLFPLVTNTTASAKVILEHYKEQPYLEKTFSTLKSVLEAVPMFLKLPHRIEAMLFLYFIALMIIALMERQVHISMKEEKIESLPILPQRMKTKKPTWNNIRYFFREVYFMSQHLVNGGLDTLTKGVTKLHKKVLSLLKVPLQLYQIKDQNWWFFSTA